MRPSLPKVATLSPSSSIAVVHPGQMGASIGAALTATGHTVAWAGAGRSAATRARAERAGLVECVDLGDLAQSETLVSVCPPHAAAEVAVEVLATGFTGLYVDVNPLSPAKKARVCALVLAAGGQFVDGGIVGPPASKPGTTRFFLSGERAADVAALFAGSPVETIVVGEAPGAASALKVAYAAYTKGTSALLANILALAEAHGVAAALQAEWQRSQPDLVASAERRVRGSADRAWRWVGEMEEIAEAFREAGLPGGFHDGAADVYRRMDAFKDQSPPPPLDEIIEAVRNPGTSE